MKLVRMTMALFDADPIWSVVIPPSCGRLAWVSLVEDCLPACRCRCWWLLCQRADVADASDINAKGDVDPMRSDATLCSLCSRFGTDGRK